MPKTTNHNLENDRGYRAALEIILSAERSGATKLSLALERLIALPPEIGRLTALRELDLHDNQLSTLPPEIGKLTKLVKLELYNNHLTALPDEIGQLSALEELNLLNNQLEYLPNTFSGLAALRLLFLSNNRLQEIPPAIFHFGNLRELSLVRNELGTIPPQIGELRALVRLSVDINNLRTLPPEIGKLSELTGLGLGHNQLTALPAELRGLRKLQWLYLHDNPSLDIPPEILGPTFPEVRDKKMEPATPRAILDYYFSRQRSASRPLNEVKLVLVGRGGSGKTSLVERLVWDKFEPGQKETLGVKLCDWTMRYPHADPVTAHVWDFAGQTITHSMHQFFLSVRTVYVLVLTGRENSEREDAEYWLKLIEAYGSEDAYIPIEEEEDGTTGHKRVSEGPPVIIALNKWDDSGSARAKVDRRKLKERYPFIVGFVETDCATKTGIGKLRELLQATVDNLEWVRVPFPAEYRRVKERLEAVPDPHLPYDAYRLICAECGVTDEGQQDSLANNLHALGVALNYREDKRLNFASVLKPHWLTEHIYTLVRHAEQKGGLLHRAGLSSVLADEKDARIRQFLVDMMVRFEIAYPLAEDDAAPEQWLVPQALPDTQPEGVEEFAGAKEVTRLRYSYRALPVSIVPRFIVRTHPFIEGELRWASGVVLTLGGARSLVRADYVEKQVEIAVTGPIEARRDLAGLAQREMRFINGQISGLNPAEEMFVEGVWVPVRTLVADEKKPGPRGATGPAGPTGPMESPELAGPIGPKFSMEPPGLMGPTGPTGPTGVATDAGTILVAPTEFLNELSKPAARDDSWKPRVFISYSHTDEAQRKRLELHLKVLTVHGVLHDKWDDRKIQPGENWDTTIKRELEEADVVLLLVSTAAIASDYIHKVEMQRALAREAAGECVVIPIILEHCAWELPELKKLQALPAGAKPVRTWTPQSVGWNSVSDGLRKVFERLREARGIR